jgi:hypothetical protein
MHDVSYRGLTPSAVKYKLVTHAVPTRPSTPKLLNMAATQGQHQYLVRPVRRRDKRGHQVACHVCPPNGTNGWASKQVIRQGTCRGRPTQLRRQSQVRDRRGSPGISPHARTHGHTHGIPPARRPAGLNSVMRLSAHLTACRPTLSPPPTTTHHRPRIQRRRLLTPCVRDRMPVGLIPRTTPE